MEKIEKMEKIMRQLTVQDIEIIKAHKEEFLKPLWRMINLSELVSSEEEYIQHDEFKKAVSEMKEIKRQGYKRQFIQFVQIVWGDDFPYED